MSKFDRKREKIKKISSGYYEMQKICNAITEELNKERIILLDSGNKKDETPLLSDIIFVDSVIEAKKEDDLCILGIIRFVAKRKDKDFTYKDNIIKKDEENEIFASYIVNSIGHIRGQSGIDDEWFFDKDESGNIILDSKLDGKINIIDLATSALDFMLLRALSWANKGQ